MKTDYLSYLFLLPVLAISSCRPKPLKVTKEDLKGGWHLNIWTSANNLIIDDTCIFVDNDVDTVFTLQYLLSHDTLTTWSSPQYKFSNRIILISKDSLILDGFYNIEGIHRYARKSTGYQ